MSFLSYTDTVNLLHLSGQVEQEDVIMLLTAPTGVAAGYDSALSTFTGYIQVQLPTPHTEDKAVQSATVDH